MVDEEAAQRVLVRKGLLSNQEPLKEITIERGPKGVKSFVSKLGVWGSEFEIIQKKLRFGLHSGMPIGVQERPLATLRVVAWVIDGLGEWLATRGQ